MEKEERDVVDGGGESLRVAGDADLLEDVAEKGEVVGEEPWRPKIKDPESCQQSFTSTSLQI